MRGITVSWRVSLGTLTCLAGCLAIRGSPAGAATIGTPDIVAIPQHVEGSGNGTLDLRLLTFSGSEVTNAALTFNGDNANTSLPQGNGSIEVGFTESYLTTAGDLKAFYNLNFATGTINELVVFLDLNETGGGMAVNTLTKLDIILNPTSIQGSPNPITTDLLAEHQTAINHVYTGGSLIASLDPAPAANLPVNSQGAGFADYAIFTGIDVFALADNDVLLINISMSNLNDGAEEVFLSGTTAPNDLPEPVASALMAMGSMSMLLWRRRASV